MGLAWLDPHVSPPCSHLFRLREILAHLLRNLTNCSVGEGALLPGAFSRELPNGSSPAFQKMVSTLRITKRGQIAYWGEARFCIGIGIGIGTLRWGGERERREKREESR